MRSFKLLFLFSVVFMVSCDSDDNDSRIVDSFDRGAMLANWADNIIIPSFENFSGFTTILEEKTMEFTAEPSEASLAALRNAYRENYVEYQTVALFQAGPAAMYYRNFLNTYPADVNAIRSRIETGDYNLELPSSYAEQGFPALDFLLYGLADTDAEILEFYTSDPNAAAYRQYLTDISTRINNLTENVVADWQNSFRDTFVSNTSASSTGSVNGFTNDYVMYYEKFLRSGKIGIPSGAFTGNPVPQNVEARFSGDLSKALYLKALETVQDFFNGFHFNSDEQGLSYKQYLDYLNTVKGGEDLSGLINSQFDTIRQQASNLDPNFVAQIETDNALMLQAFEQLQKNVVLLKVDMLQALSISVDYVDSDGD